MGTYASITWLGALLTNTNIYAYHGGTIYRADLSFPGTYQPYVMSATYTTTSLTLGMNPSGGVANGTPGSIASISDLKMYIGKLNGFSNNFQGYIGEVIVYKKALTSSETADIRSYLKNKWGL